MNDIRYIISDASKRVEVEPHVLRYWEEELSLLIPRNELGHRYYRDEDILKLKAIKLLKEQGFQLRAIKILLPDIHKIEKLDSNSILKLREELHEKVSLGEEVKLVATKSSGTSLMESSIPPPALSNSVDKMDQFKQILQGLITNAIKENNGDITTLVSNTVSDNVIKEVDYILRSQEEREEERFRTLDETLRSMQKSKQEVATSDSLIKQGKKRYFFKRK